MSSIYFHLAGRLGNQLFQYAFAHQLSTHFDKEVKFFCDKYHHVLDYEWSIDAQMSDCQHISKLIMSNNRGLFLKVSDALFVRNRIMFEFLNRSLRIMRTMDAFDYPLMPNNSPHLVTGFYLNAASVEASPIFVKELENHLSKNSFNNRFSLENDYEVVHIRGGDMKNSVYGTLDRNYYASLPGSHRPRYVLTDDTRHAERLTKEMKIVKVFTPEELNPWEAIELMRRSKKVYASNSTLAWWGGYLCMKNGGDAFLPNPFFKGNFTKSGSLYLEGFKYLQGSFE